MSDGSFVACSPDQEGPWHRQGPQDLCQIRVLPMSATDQESSVISMIRSLRDSRSVPLAVVLLASTGLVNVVRADTVKIVSYNVLANWDEARGDRIAAVIQEQEPDVVGLQEVVGQNVDYLLSTLGEEFSVHFRTTPAPIFISKDSGLRLVELGSTELVRCAIDRQVNWVRLEEPDSGKQLIYYNTHLCFIFQNTLDDYTNEEANQLQASRIMDVMVDHAEDDLVQIIGGDLNIFASSNTTRFFLEGRPLPVNGRENPLALKDSWAAAPGNAGEKPRTLTRGGRGGGQGQRRPPGGPGGRGRGRGRGVRLPTPDEPGIDWLFVSESANVIAAEVISNDLTSGANGASDHLPISATIQF